MDPSEMSFGVDLDDAADDDDASLEAELAALQSESRHNKRKQGMK